MSDPTRDSERESRARLEKFAQTHLDRAQTLSAGTTRTALAWAVALGLIWFQPMEHRLTLVRTAQRSQNALATISQTDAEQIGADRLGAMLETGKANFRTDESAASAQTIELPFSIKLTVPPYWVPTLWLLLALGLTIYMHDARRRILRLVVTGIRLQREAGVNDPRFRCLVGGGVWWLAPVPSRIGPTPDSDSFREVFGWQTDRVNTIAAAGAAATLLLVQSRVQYVSLCIGAGLMAAGNGFLQNFAWLSIILLDLALGSVIALLVFKWFFAPGDSRKLEEPASGEPALQNVGITRRRALYLAFGGVFSFLALICNVTAMYAFAAARLGRLPVLIDRTVTATGARRRRRHHKKPDRAKENRDRAKASPLPFGLYVNPRTGTVHISAPTKGSNVSPCASCIRATWAARLKKIEPSRILWNEGLRARDSLSVISAPSAPAVSALPSPTRRFEGATHPHIAHRTFMVEQQALALLHSGSRGPDEAIQFLLDATKAVSVFGLRTGVRLYDLLAGLAVRYDHKPALDQLSEILRGELRKVEEYSKNHAFTGTNVANQLAPWLRPLLAIAGIETNSEPKLKAASRHRSHPRHHEKGNGVQSAQAHAPQAQIPPADHQRFLADALRARLEKWSSKADTKWAPHWKKKEEIRWGGVKLPALTKS
jgi:hypothetical protein